MPPVRSAAARTFTAFTVVGDMSARDADKSYHPRYGQMAYASAQVHRLLLVLHGTYARWRLGHPNQSEPLIVSS